MGRFTKKRFNKPRDPLPPDLTPFCAPVEKQLCPCGRHFRTTSEPVWGERQCCGEQPVKMANTARYAQCSHCRAVYWADPGGGVTLVSSEGIRTLQHLFLLR